MKQLTAYLIHLTVISTIVLSIGLVIWGCGSVVDGGYEPIQGEWHHPFATAEDHGSYLSSHGYRFTECTACHGVDLRGVDNGVFTIGGEKDRSCYQCHNNSHHSGMADASSEHPGYLCQTNWELAQCYHCHYPGGAASGLSLGGSCSSAGCHSLSTDGPNACNSCHGQASLDPDDPVNWAPPFDLQGNEAVNNPGVGMHRSHVQPPSGTARPMRCTVCHNQPETWDSPGHIIDDTPGRAEVVFHSPSTAESAEPLYDAGAFTCSSTHCHGGSTANWRQPGGWSSCTACHGMPPGGGHPQWPSLNQCHWCHGEVVDENGNIIAPLLHVNGAING